MLLSNDELFELIDRGVIENAKIEAVNAASIDIHLGPVILVEEPGHAVIDYRARTKPKMREVHLHEGGYVLRPGDFILAQSVEVFNLPTDISAEYKLKSSMARIGLDHLNAGWCDAGCASTREILTSRDCKDGSSRSSAAVKPHAGTFASGGTRPRNRHGVQVAESRCSGTG